MPLALFLIEAGGTLRPFEGSYVEQPPPPPPPPPPWDVYLDGVLIGVDDFGLSATFVPYYDDTAVTGGEEAVFGVSTGGVPYLER